MFWIVIAAFVALVSLAVIIYVLPADKAVQAKRKKDKAKKNISTAETVPVDNLKDWKSIAERWENKNHALSGEIEKLKMGQKTAQQFTDEIKDQHKQLVEKLALEKSWREKEQETLEKIKAHEKELKDQIYRTESDLEKEHSHRLRLEREFQELKIKHEETLEERRQIAIKAGSLQATLDAITREIRDLKFENRQLKEKREDIQWVAKSAFDELKETLRRKEQEIALLKQAPPAAS